MIILGGITLQACVLGALLRPEEGLVRRAKIQKYLIEILTRKIFQVYLLNHLFFLQSRKEENNAKQENILVNIFKELINVKLLKENIPFLFICVSNFFSFLVYFVTFIYIPIRAKE